MVYVFTDSLPYSHKLPSSPSIPILTTNHNLEPDSGQPYYSFLYLIFTILYSYFIISPTYSIRINKEAGMVVRLILTQSGRGLQMH